MIEGSFDRVRRRPYVQGRLFLPRLGVDRNIDFLVDTGADTTTIHPPDTQTMGINYPQLGPATRPQMGIGGVDYAHEEPAVIAFEDGSLERIYYVITAIPRPSEHNMGFPSLLGQDIIQHWRMVHDKPRDRLTFTAQRADLSIRGDVNDLQVVDN